MTIIPTPFPLFLEKNHHQPSLDPKKRLGNPFFSQFCSECPSSSILMGPKTLDLRWVGSWSHQQPSQGWQGSPCGTATEDAHVPLASIFVIFSGHCQTGDDWWTNRSEPQSLTFIENRYFGGFGESFFSPQQYTSYFPDFWKIPKKASWNIGFGWITKATGFSGTDI